MQNYYRWSNLDCEQTKEKLISKYGNKILKDLGELKIFKKSIKYFKAKYNISEHNMNIIIKNLYKSEKMNAFSIFQMSNKDLRKDIDKIKEELKEYHKIILEKYKLEYDEFLKLLGIDLLKTELVEDIPKEEKSIIKTEGVSKKESFIMEPVKPLVQVSLFDYGKKRKETSPNKKISQKKERKQHILNDILEKCRECSYYLKVINNNNFKINDKNVILRTNFADLSGRYKNPKDQTFVFPLATSKLFETSDFVIFYIGLRNEYHIVPTETLKGQTNICFGNTKRKTKNLVSFEKFRDEWHLLSFKTKKDYKVINSKVLEIINKSEIKKITPTIDLEILKKSSNDINEMNQSIM